MIEIENFANFARTACEDPDHLINHFSSDPKILRKDSTWLKANLVSSKRYVVDDTLTTAAMVLGVQYPEVLNNMVAQARLPFNSIFIEWSIPARLKAVDKPHDNDIAEKSGCLIQRIYPDREIYMLTPVTAVTEGNGMRPGMISISPLSLIYDIKATDFKHPDEKTIIEFLGNGSEEFMKRSLVGGTYIGSSYTASSNEGRYSFMDVNDEILMQKIESCRRVTDRVSWCITPCKRDYLLEKMKTNSSLFRKAIAFHFDEVISESSGIWRFIISILAILNDNEIKAATITSEKKSGNRMVKGKIVPYMECHRLSINLPRTDMVKTFNIRHVRNLPVRAHEVSGHYRSYQKGPHAGKKDCEHHYIDITNTNEECVVCGKRRWWVRDFVRGDASVGFVKKDYHLNRRR